MYFIHVLMTLSDKGREMQHNDFSFSSKKKKKRRERNKTKKGMNLEYPKQNFVSKTKARQEMSDCPAAVCFKT